MRHSITERKLKGKRHTAEETADIDIHQRSNMSFKRCDLCSSFGASPVHGADEGTKPGVSHANKFGARAAAGSLGIIGMVRRPLRGLSPFDRSASRGSLRSTRALCVVRLA